MKTHKKTRKQINNSFKNTLNQKVMKTKKYSISKKACMAAVFSFVFSAFLFGQFETPNPDSPNPQTGEEVRSSATGFSIDYDIFTNHVPGEEYRWAVRGGTITAGGAVTSSGDTSIVEWTANAYEITVNWDTDLSLDSIGSVAGEIIVQKRTGNGCPSQLQILPITMWNPATAGVVDDSIEICSGELVGGSVTIGLTGAPDPVADGFEVTYNVTASDLTDLGGNPLAATGSTVVSNTSTVTIPLPDGLINGTTADAYYTIELTDMHDDFTGSGTIAGDGTYTIVVHPTPETGEIQSSSSLTRRL
jgi:hypothetical protein